MLQKELAGIPNFNIRITPKQIKEEPNNISCCKSHFEAILTAWQDGSEFALIVEDDVVGLKDMIINNKFLKHLVSSFPSKWNIIQLHYISPGMIPVAEEKEKKSRKHHLVEGYLMGAACYLISRKGMFKFLLKMGTPKLKKWIEVVSHLPSHLPISQRKSHPLFCSGENELGCTFFEGARAEEFIYGHFDDGGVYFSLLPLVNTLEEINGGSDISTSLSHYNYENMILLNGVFKRNPNFHTYDFETEDVLHIPKEVHWITSSENVLFI